MAKIFSIHSLIRQVSIILIAILFVILAFLSDNGFPLSQIICVSLVSGCLVSLLFPTCCGSLTLSLWFCSGISAVLALSCLAGIRFDNMIWLEQIMLISYLAAAGGAGVSRIGDISRSGIAWKGMELFSKMFYSCVFLVVSNTGAYFKDTDFLWCICAFLLVLYAVLYARNWFAVTMFFPSRVERCARMLDKKDVRVHSEDAASDKPKLAVVYDRAVKAVEEKQLYLKKKYSLEDLSREVFCNKTFLSRAINAYSGKGFCYFMNCFRVKYAMSLLDKNQKILVKELAFICGFSNVVTFNMAFKAVSGKTPTEYVDCIKASILNPSRKTELGL